MQDILLYIYDCVQCAVPVINNYQKRFTKLFFSYVYQVYPIYYILMAARSTLYIIYYILYNI